ncbi:hypothetical protein BD309DRAFT_955415 [Dichomitus squalens]|nr:hypothetical protein BD309DRAFT_955415 [Dichomitus squalens]
MAIATFRPFLSFLFHLPLLPPSIHIYSCARTSRQSLDCTSAPHPLFSAFPSSLILFRALRIQSAHHCTSYLPHCTAD